MLKTSSTTLPTCTTRLEGTYGSLSSRMSLLSPSLFYLFSLPLSPVLIIDIRWIPNGACNIQNVYDFMGQTTLWMDQQGWVERWAYVSSRLSLLSSPLLLLSLSLSSILPSPSHSFTAGSEPWQIWEVCQTATGCSQLTGRPTLPSVSSTPLVATLNLMTNHL